MPMDIRCSNGQCTRLLAKDFEGVQLEIRCPKCGTTTRVQRKPDLMEEMNRLARSCGTMPLTK